MRLLYVSKFQFKKMGGQDYALPAYGNHFWEKYLDVFDGIDILAEEVKSYLDNGTLSQITDPRISVEILERNTAPNEIVNDFKIKRTLRNYIEKADAILIKPASRKGMMAIKIAKKLNKPYMIEMTGDLKLTLQNNHNLLKKIYGGILHKQVLSAIKDCPFGLYVTESYLQKVYPIKGKQCGCTDTVLPYISEGVLKKRIKKIESMSEGSDMKIGMVASYHDSRKGIDTAIKALANLKEKNITLHILGLGTQEDRDKWYEFAKQYSVDDRLFFDPSVSGVENVLLWNDEMDICILPSRSEGLPRCIVESISRGCPNIVSNVCGMPELVGEHWIHEIDDYEKLASLIEELLLDKDLLKKVANESFEHSKNYEFDVLKKKRNAFLSEFREYCENYKK